MFNILCVSNRTLCKDVFLQRIERIAASSPSAIILREKDLEEAEYRELAKQVLAVCQQYQVPCILHTYSKVAIELGENAIHLPLTLLQKMMEKEKRKFSVIGTSCHSLEQAKLAEELGCTYITFGHVFDTECKKGLPPRGTVALAEICKQVTIPVYAIGGIDESNLVEVKRVGANGACIMSGCMCCDNPEEYVNTLREIGEADDIS